MNWMRASQKKFAMNVETVEDLIKFLQRLPPKYQKWPLRNVDSGKFCEMNVATDGKDKEVSIYQEID